MRTVSVSLTPPFSRFGLVPDAQGLYDPAAEKDACGLAMVATLRGTAGHDIITAALDALRHLEHRGAVGSDAGTGDGAGIVTQIPDEFLREVVSFPLPSVGSYAVGNAFLPVDPTSRSAVKRGVRELAASEGLDVLGWREVPVRPDELGTLARAAMPVVQQLFVQSSATTSAGERLGGIALDRLATRLRKRAERQHGAFFCSLSSRTLVYKGMVTTLQLEPFYPDLSDERFVSRLALVHSRYSTNTFPSWPLAQPFRLIAHNGEINTVQGNRNWMRARQSQLESELLGDLAPILPIVTPGASDSASFDEVVELLTLAGRSLPHAIMMMVPEAWENQTEIDPERRAFYEYHSMLMEPWDGPAAIVFTDGTLVGATLDRNGLRPGRYIVTDDGLVVLASEIGVLDIEQSRIVRKGRLQPGRMFLVDTEAGRLIEDDEIKADPAAGLDPRGGGALARPLAGPRAQPPHRRSRARAPGLALVPRDRQRRAREDRAHRPVAGPSHHGDDPRSLPGRRGRRRHARPAHRDLRRGRRRHRRRRGVHRAERPRLEQGPRADPVAAHALGGAPPPHPFAEPHEGRARRRSRRRARGASRGAAHRLRGIRRE